MLTPFLSASFCSMPSTSLRSAPAFIISLKLMPAYSVPSAAFSRFLAATVPFLASSAIRLLSCVVACAVGVPAAVMFASDAPTWSKETPKAAAVGVTCASDAPSSPTVVIPKFCVCISTFCISSTVPALSPYAFMVLAVAASAVSTSVKPAAAKCADCSSMFAKSSCFTPALSALYAASAKPLAASPVLLLIFKMSSLSCLNSSSVPLNSVPVLAIDVSNSAPNLIDAPPIAAMAAIAAAAAAAAALSPAVTTPPIVSPSDLLFFSVSSISSPASSVAFSSSSISFAVLDSSPSVALRAVFA